MTTWWRIATRVSRFWAGVRRFGRATLNAPTSSLITRTIYGTRRRHPRCLLKLSEVDSNGTASPYFQRAKQIADSWPYVDHSFGDRNPARAIWIAWSAR